MLLSADELYQLTKRQRSSAQARVLRFMGIEYRQRPNGTLAVSRAHVDAMLGGVPKGESGRKAEPDWSAV